jgi:polygalacturonase/lysophospholipase L1-like esterase
MKKKIFILSLVLIFLSFTAKERITVYTIGDSTMANKNTNGNPERGWAMALPAFFDATEVKIENHAMNGRSTKSFIDEGRWEKVVNKLKSGDYVFIQFGHNDEKKDKPSVYADPHGAYRDNLTRFVNETRAKGAYPVLMTSIVRRHFDENGVLKNTHGEYPDVVRKLAKELDVPLIDIEAKSRKLIQDLGDEESKKLFVWFGENVYPKFPKGKKDSTHLNGSGAHLIAQLAVDGIRELKLPPEKHLLPCDFVTADAPFPMPPIRVFHFPQRDFPITNFGAVEGGEIDNTRAITLAINACNQAGGGRVVVPAGTWFTGSIHFKSNVNLHLEEGAVLHFTDNPADFLPAVMTSWEGMECYNYSPLIYAFECENIAITGEGKLQPRMNTWKKWFARPQAHLDALKKLYTTASTDVPVEQRQMAEGENNLRPHLIHFNRCKNVLLDGFQIRESPFWTIHLYMCNGGLVRNLDVKAHGHNNDGIDFEMSRNFLVENCTFDQGDDAVVIKSGRNRDAWRLNTPCENIVIRNCKIVKGHVLLGIGSEISGGVRNINMHDCEARDVHRFFFIKTNHRRGGFVENIYMENVKAGKTQRIFEIDADVLYQWKDLVPTYEIRITRIEGIYLKNVVCDEADAVYDIKGDARLPVQSVNIENITVGKLNKFIGKSQHAGNISEKNILQHDRIKTVKIK